MTSLSLITERPDYFEIAGFRLAKTNFGEPTDRSIEINPETASHAKSQAWSKDIDGITHWFYNFRGAQQEAENLGVKIPTLDEQMKIFTSVPGNIVEKAQILWIPLVGYRNMHNGEFSGQWGRASLWTSSYDGEMMADSICLQRSCQHAHGNLYGHALGLSIRAFVKENS